MNFTKFESSAELKMVLQLSYQAPGCYHPVLDIYNKWRELHRPFYRVYPGFIDCINRVDFRKVLQEIVLPLDSIEIQIPENYHYEGCMPKGDSLAWYSIRSIIVSRIGTTWKGLISGFNLDDSNTLINAIIPDMLSYGHFSKDGDVFKKDIVIPFPLRILYGLQLILNDSELMQPIPLKRDAEKWKATGDISLIERARRNGVNGWAIGEAIPTNEEIAIARERGELKEGSKSPHYRAGTFGLRWTGAGRTIPKIVKIRDSWVNWDKVKTVPTGYRED